MSRVENPLQKGTLDRGGLDLYTPMRVVNCLMGSLCAKWERLSQSIFPRHPSVRRWTIIAMPLCIVTRRLVDF
jgi:hypothetical protein